MTGDELIAYGFKRIVEELQEMRGALVELRSSLDNIGGSAEEAAKAARLAASTADKSEHNTFMLNDTVIHIANVVDKIQADTFTTGLNVIRIEQSLIKEDKHESKLEGI